MAFIDGGATTSFISKSWVLQNKLPIIPKGGKIVQFLSGSELPREGVVKGLTLENGNRKIIVDLEVATMSREDQLVIGIDLFEPLGYELQGVPYTWPIPGTTGVDAKPPKVRIEYPPGVNENGIATEWEKVIADNQAIPKT